MKLSRVIVLTTITFSLFFVAAPTQAQSTLTFTEWAIPTSTNCPFYLHPVSHDLIYFAEAQCSASGGAIGSLNTKTNTVTEWASTGIISPQGVTALGSSILFVDQTANTINMLNPKTNTLTTWGVPAPSYGPLSLVAVGTGIFFTEQSGKIAMLDRYENEITEWAVPGGNHNPLDIAATEDGSGIWFSQGSGSQLNVLNLDDNTFQQWTIPGSLLASPTVRGIAVSEQDHVFFADGLDSAIGSLDPSTNTITAWITPGFSSPTELQVQELAERGSESQEPFRVDFTDPAENLVWRLLTALQVGASTTVLPTTTAVTPTVTLVTPSTSTLTRTSSVLTPTVTSVSGVVTGGFEQWVVPTGNSDDFGIAELPGGGVAFTEANGNKIGTLR